MTLRLEVHKAEDERLTEQDLALVGTATRIGDHSVEVTLAPGERARLEPLLARGKTGPRGRPPVRVVDADRLIAWQLYWRGENFWSGDEIWGYPPEMKTAFKEANNTAFTKYINDRARAPLGRRYFLVTEAGRITGAAREPADPARPRQLRGARHHEQQVLARRVLAVITARRRPARRLSDSAG